MNLDDLTLLTATIERHMQRAPLCCNVDRVDLAKDTLSQGFRRAEEAEKPAAAPAGRAAELLAMAHSDPRLEAIKPFEGLVRRLALRCHFNGCKDARDVFEAVRTAKIRDWKHVGENGIRDICRWLATKFPTDPPPREPATTPTTNGH